MNNAKQIEQSRNRMPLNKRIAYKCLECSGGSAKEVTLCHLFDCPLWAVRFGYTMKDKRYKERMKNAQDRYLEEFKELTELGIKLSDFYVEKHNMQIPAD